MALTAARLAVFLTAAGLATACATTAPVERQELVWPLPPEQPRVRFVESFEKRGHYGAEAGAERIKAALMGEDAKSRQRMAKPYSVTTDIKGRVYVSDTGLGIVWVFDPEQRKVRFIGDSGSLRLATPSGLAVDDRERVFVSDARHDRVFVFDQQGELVMSIGQKDELRQPAGLAIDRRTGRLYVADAGRHKIRVYDSRTGRFVFEFGERGSTPGTFNFPTHLFLGHNRLYVTDTMNFRVQVFDLEGTYLTKVGEMGSSLGQLARPKGVAVDAEGNVYVVDAAFNNFQIFNDKAELLMFVGGVGTKDGQFWLPAGLHIDEHDRVYVVDQYNRRVQVFQYMGERYLAKQKHERAKK